MSYLIARKADENDPEWGVVFGHVVLGIPRKTKKAAARDMANLDKLNQKMHLRGFPRHHFFLIEAETKREAAIVLAELVTTQ